MSFKNFLNPNKRPTKTQKAELFWNWFNLNKHQYLFLNQVEAEEKERLMDILLAELKKYHKHLTFEIGGHAKEEKLDLIISAEGFTKYFPAVEFLVKNAPKLSDWEVIAFKPPMGIGFVLDYRGYTFDPEKIIFIPMYSKNQPKNVGLRICYPEYTEDKKNTFWNGTYLILDSILGEKATNLDIDFLDVVQTPENIGEFDFRHLCDIQEFIDEVKER